MRSAKARVSFSRRFPCPFARLRSAKARVNFSRRFPRPFARLRNAKAQVSFSCRFTRPLECLSTAKVRPFWYYQLRPRPTSATCIEHLAAPLRLNQHQLLASNVLLYLYNSTNISYLHRTSSCTSMTRPISATLIERLAAPLQTSATRIERLAAPIYDFDHTSYRHQPSS